MRPRTEVSDAVWKANGIAVVLLALELMWRAPWTCDVLLAGSAAMAHHVRSLFVFGSCNIIVLVMGGRYRIGR